MYTMDQIFDAATAAESAARCLHWAQTMKLENLNGRADHHVDNALSHLKGLAQRLGFDLTPLLPAPRERA